MKDGVLTLYSEHPISSSLPVCPGYTRPGSGYRSPTMSAPALPRTNSHFDVQTFVKFSPWSLLCLCLLMRMKGTCGCEVLKGSGLRKDTQVSRYLRLCVWVGGEEMHIWSYTIC